MARLFDVSIDNIGLHIKNILKDNELDKSTTEESSEVRIEGNRKVRRKVLIYNLDMIQAFAFFKFLITFPSRTQVPASPILIPPEIVINPCFISSLYA